MAEDLVLPDRETFKAADVCELLGIAPYVLRSWENEFKDLGVARTAGGARVYRRQDVERAHRIKGLMLHDGLTLAGVRRRLEQEAGTPDAADEPLHEVPPAARGAQPLKEQVRRLRDELRELHSLLSTHPEPQVRPTADRRSASPTESAFELSAPQPPPRRLKRRTD